VDAVLIRPLPYSSPARLVRLEETTSKRPNIGITAAEYLQWRERIDLFGATAAYVRDTVGDEAPDQVWMVRVTRGLFPRSFARSVRHASFPDTSAAH
jgi:hypothetical protein